MEHSQNKGQHFKWSAFSFTEIAMSAFFSLWLQTHLRQARFYRLEFGTALVCLSKRSQNQEVHNG